MTAKMQGPANHGGLSHDGVSYEPDEKGLIDVPEHVIPHAFGHGFTLVADAATPPAKEDGNVVDLTKLKKADLIAFAKDTLGLDLDAAKTIKELIADIEAAKIASVTPPAKEDGAE